METKALPSEIIVDILSRVGVKDLLRFRCVAKPWCSLIDGPDFIKLHLNRSSETRVVFGGRNDLYWVDPEALDSPQRLSFPMDIGIGIDILGGCNGLIALANPDGDIAIWNPTTRKHRALTNSMSEVKHYPIPLLAVFTVTLVGFGYDPIGDDYKLLRLVSYEASERALHSVVTVYSLKNDAWRRVSDFPSHFRYDSGNLCLVGNALYWVVTRISDDSDSLVAFDLVSEALCDVPLPDMDLSLIKNPCMRLANLGGCLCVSMLGDFNLLFQRSERVDMWVMKEYGVKESWTKLFSVAPPSSISSFMFAEPIAYLKGQDRILLNWDAERFVVYDAKRKIVRNVRGPGIVPIVDTHVCRLSLCWSQAEKALGSKQSRGRTEKQKHKQQLSGGNKKRDDFLSKGFKLKL